MRSQAIDKWQTRREAGTQSHGALVVSRATDAPGSWDGATAGYLTEVFIVRRLFGAGAEALILVILVIGLLAVPVLAAKGGGNGGGGGGGGKPPKPGGTAGTISLVMVSDANFNGVPNWGDSITWNVSRAGVANPFVSLTCSQGGTMVLSTWAGYYAGYEWPAAQTMTLSGDAWTGGAADCSASLYGTSTVVNFRTEG